MSDGKRVVKSDVVILSIKPPRPEFSPEKKHVLVKVALHEWDKLDAYYRGQILKLKNKVKATVVTRKSSKSSIHHKRSGDHKKSFPRRRSTSGHQLTELFGDENIISFDHHNDNDSYPSSHRGSDEENKRPLEPQHRSRKHKDGNKAKIKSEKIKSAPPQKQENEENFLSIPRDNFVIEFAIGEKKRTPIHRPDPPGFISPIKVEPYKPPIAIGFNVVHIQKILYHSGSVQHTSPTTTSAQTPEKSTHIEGTSPTLINCEKLYDGNKPSYGHQKMAFGGNNANKGSAAITTTTSFIKNTSCSFNKDKAIFMVADDGSQQTNAITSTSLLTKRKSDNLTVPEANNIINNNNTTIMSGDMHSPPNKKPATERDLLREKMPPPPSRQLHHGSLNNTLKSCVSITDTIIKKAKELPPELKERERRRNLECQKRRDYALRQKTQDRQNDFVDVSMKAMEMIWKTPLLSPIRSP